jgi:nonsense-mediated mRNA decay protein 3
MENMKIEINSTNDNNILFKPDKQKLFQQIVTESNNNNAMQGNPDNININASLSVLNRSSMMTYSKIVCCVCSAIIDANSKGMCSTCAKTEVNITDGITKTGLIFYCKGCDRYLRPPWVRCGGSLESPEMMILCLGKIKGLNKVKLVDSSFVWTEPHSKLIKIKLTVQKEMDKTLIQTSLIVEFKTEWTQCDDCKKTFTPHIWNASCQVRQKVKHKRTFMLLEQMILKHRAHDKAINIKEHPEGVDFYFINKSQALAFCDFIQSMLPSKVKQSKQLISHDQNSNLFHYKYTFMIELAPVSIDDLIILDKETSKELGGIGPVMLCYKQSSRIHLVDPLTFQTYDVDGSTYWKYGFRSYVDRLCLTELLIINVEEEIDYNKKYARVANSLISGDIDMVSIDTNSKLNQSKSTNYKNPDKSIKSTHSKREPGYHPHYPFKIVTVQCILNNQKGSDGEVKLITTRCHLGGKIRPGDIFLGYDLNSLNPNMELDDILVKADSIPDVILVKKKYNRGNVKRNWKLKHLNKETDVDMTGKGKQHGDLEKQYEEFIRDIEENKDMRKNINLYRDEEAIKELEGRFKDLKMNDNKEDELEIEIKVDELLRDLDLNDEDDTKPKKKDSIDVLNDEHEDSGEDIKNQNKNTKQLGKRERTGKKINHD